ncbi:MarR family winged helix-turn-helix transcriptional regulator [Geobacillus sp. C56-T2]|uniref:MarR family winged helix-turn-helix transcriptional regulator n=1 Tax=Geobacillus sp. C56-T2 TaxID=600773 RepID=UPI0011AAC0A3|nr:MarR family transcriptional regulator [Geobacillus sp. C56-T2]NNV08091.1 MarR family transcriptional regulator [Geobacillus sp. MMMUD3]TWG30548.1 DNA-binding MarR family transcriptional regulator [Geobacillus sp. C56-T2]
MDDLKALYQAIKEKNDAVTAFLLQEIRAMLGAEYQELTQRQVMLLEILRHQTMTINEIAQFFSITPSAASQLVRKLEEKAYVRRDINPTDRREIIVRLDQAGQTYHDKMGEVELRLMEKYYGKLQREDLEKLKEINDKLYTIIIEAHRS